MPSHRPEIASSNNDMANLLGYRKDQILKEGQRESMPHDSCSPRQAFK